MTANDLGCDWICDYCSAYMNDQPGFQAGDTWVCAECGTVNDMSEDNIGAPKEVENNYTGSYQYYLDEEKRAKEEEEKLWELGIDPND